MYSPLAHRLLAARSPLASVYYDDSHDTQDAAERLHVIERDVARELEQRGAPLTLISSVTRAMNEQPAGEQRSGRALVVGLQGTVIDEHLVVAPVTPLVRFSQLPYIVPLVEYGAVWGPYMVVAVDQVGADLTRYHGKSTTSETIVGEGFPVHKAAAAGLNAWGDSQHRVEEAVRKNVRAVGDRLTREMDRDPVDFIVLIGQDRVRAELVSVLPHRVAERTVQPGVGSRQNGVDRAVRAAIAQELNKRRSIKTGRAVDQYQAETGRGSGLAVAGLAAVTAALRDRAVTTLLIGRMHDETVLAGDDLTLPGPDPETLSDFAIAPTRTLRADEALPFSAMAIGADLVCAPDDLRLADGVGALVRYASAQR
ncbi:hypothetical protein AB431_12155 [Mycobacterium sp. EPa45]|nr:hypothetical protein AB431_12155 [Mycobacterium sp. EPa45]